MNTTEQIQIRNHTSRIGATHLVKRMPRSKIWWVITPGQADILFKLGAVRLPGFSEK